MNFTELALYTVSSFSSLVLLLPILLLLLLLIIIIILISGAVTRAKRA